MASENNSLMLESQAQFPHVWAESNPPGLAKYHLPITAELLAMALSVQVKQDPISQKAREGMSHHIQRLLQANILRSCKSAWNTPFLPVKKPGTNDYQPVQDLREVNKQTATVHPTVPNPYTLLSLLPPNHTVYTVLDLKDAFFAIPLAPKSQSIFAFEWTDPNSVDTTQIPIPTTKKRVWDFLGATGYCCLWIPGFAEIAKPLYTTTSGSGELVWTETEKQAFQNLKNSLTEAPALALLDVSKPFYLFVHKNKGISKGVLTQTLGPWQQPVVYLSKRLDQVASVKILLKGASEKWMSNSRILQYQSLLLDQPRLTFHPAWCLNPAALFTDLDLSAPIHDCQEILEVTETGRPNLQDTPLKQVDATLFTDGSSFINQGVHKAGAAVTTETDIIWAQILPVGTSTQKAKLIALTQALS
ncbi:Gag-Pol polyprotein [Plecturocebus cupreus]